MTSKLALRSLLLVFVVLFSLSFAHAQYRAGIQGVILDSQGAVVDNATIALTSRDTGVTKTATSDANGVYNITGLAPGHYSLSVEKTGFKKQVLEDVGVTAEQVQGVNVTLQIGSVNESVTVSGDSSPLLETETANLSGTVKSDDFQKLPSLGRDPFQLLQLAPGAFGDGAQGAGGGTSNLPGTTVGGTGWH